MRRLRLEFWLLVADIIGTVCGWESRQFDWALDRLGECWGDDDA